MKRFLLVYIVILPLFTYAQQRLLTGKVYDSENLPLPDAIVEITGGNSTQTDADGNYSIKIKPGENITFSFFGLESKTITIYQQTTLNVKLEMSQANKINKVVVTALGIKKNTRSLGYSLTEVKGDELSAVRHPNVINALEGKVAGVNVTQNATGPAGSSRVIIRGASSLTGNNQPLYVVDGIPIGNNNNGSAGMWGGTDGGDGISSINNDDIETISVLKGGAASALYGSRAAGGVILITTKSGKNKRFGIEFNNSLTFDKVNTSIQDFQKQYGQGRNGKAPVNKQDALDAGFSSWGEKLNPDTLRVSWDGVKRPYKYAGNNLKRFYKTGTTLTQTLSIQKGSEDMDYRFSASNLTNQGIIPNSELNRKTFSLNSSATLAKKLTSTINAKYIIEKVKNRPRLSDSPGNINFTLLNLPPNLDVREKPATLRDGRERRIVNNVYIQNPYFAAYKFRNEDTKNRIITSGTLRYDILKWLYVMGRAGIDHYTIRKTEVEPWGTAYKPEGSIEEKDIRYTQVDADFIMGVQQNITDKLATNALFGANKNTEKNEELKLRGEKFISPDIEDISNTKQKSQGRDFKEREISSLYWSIEFSYDKWAYLTFTGRNDWFSTLSYPGKTTPNNFYYPSVSASFIASKAFRLPDFINFLKLRGGYSQVAGGAQDPYQLALTYEIFSQGHLGQPLGRISTDKVPNDKLVPFDKKEIEVGFNTRLFQNRLNLDVAYYNNKTTNDIVPVTNSVFSGYSSSLVNLGKIRNRGVEVLLNLQPIKNHNFKWTGSINGAYNEGKVLATDSYNSNVNLDQPRTQNVSITHIVGKPYGVIFGRSYARDDKGRIIYEMGSDGVPLAKYGEYKILGKGVPPLTIGFSNTFRYKNFNLSFLIDGKFGAQIFSGTNALAYQYGLHKDTLEGRENGLTVSGVYFDRKSKSLKAFTKTVAPKDLSAYYERISKIAEEFVYDADFIKFRQISLGYSLSSKILKEKFHNVINGIRISLIANNLFFIKRSVKNIDPESAYNVSNSQGLEYYGVPSTRSYGFNINIKF